MSYHFLNISSGYSFSCDEETWRRCLETAEKEGWRPDGTLFDYDFVLEEMTDESDDLMQNLFMGLVVHHSFLAWDGSYTEKANQIVSFEDAHYLALCLKGAFDNRELIEFIAGGSFRICEI